MGLKSHANCKTKGSILQTYVDCHPVAKSLLPTLQEVTGLDARDVLPNAWVHTVHVNLFELMIADALDSDEAFLLAARRSNEKLLSTRTYRAIVFVASPAFLIRTATARWSHFHRGAPLVGRASGNTARLTLGFPSHLHPPLIVREKANVFAVAVEAAGGRLTRLEVTAEPTEGRVDMEWE